MLYSGQSTFLQELSQLYERRHVWNYFDDDNYNDLFKNHVEKIYNFFRHSVIKKLNERNSTNNNGIGNVITFSLPLRYMQFPESEYMFPLVFSYTIENNPSDVLMNVRHIPNSDKLLLKVCCNLYKDNFKSLFFHEMKHYVQLSRMKSQFSDYYKMAYLQNGSKIFNDNDVITLFKIVDMCNPQEVSAYLEQIYQEAFSRMYSISSSTDINNLISEIYKKYNLDKETHKILIDKIKSNDFEFLEYIATLFLINIHELNTKQHHYTFFTRDDYNLTKVRQMRKHLSEVANNKDELGDVIEIYANEVIKDNDLMNRLKESFIRNFIKHKRNLKNYINSTVYSAKEDYDKLQSSSLARQYNQQVRNYIRITDTKNVVAEMICSDGDNDWILEIYAKSISNVILKMRRLIDMINSGDNDFEIDFGFSYSFENRIEKIRKIPNLNFEIFIQDIDDVFEAVKFLNQLD